MLNIMLNIQKIYVKHKKIQMLNIRKYMLNIKNIDVKHKKIQMLNIRKYRC